MAISAPEPHYTIAGDIEIAYAVFGSEDRTILRVPSLGAGIDDLPDAGGGYWRMNERLADIARVVVFDRRGQGLSTRTFGFGTAEDRMDDIRLVLDTLGIERAVLVADHDAVCLALLFAAAYPDRVTVLVLASIAAPRTRWAEDYPIGLPDEVLDSYVDWVGRNWGNGRVSATFVEEVTDYATAARLERATCTPLIAREHFRLANLMDVRSALPAVQAPTLILHSEQDSMPVAWARYLAEHLDDAVLLEDKTALYSNFLMQEEVYDSIEEFVTGERPRPIVDIDRVLATVLFVDVVGSTEQLTRVGDRRWRGILDDFRAAVRIELERYRGREVNTRGDDVLATFDGSTRAVRCAIAIVHAAAPLGLDVRAGAHSGEVELQGADVAGIAVHIGARVCGAAEGREVLVTATLRDLVAGSGLEFEARGAHELKGVPATIDLFAVVP